MSVYICFPCKHLDITGYLPEDGNKICEGIQSKYNQVVLKGNLGKADRKKKEIFEWKKEIGVLMSDFPKEGKLRCSFMVDSFPSAALKNSAILALINTFS